MDSEPAINLMPLIPMAACALIMLCSALGIYLTRNHP